MFQIETLGLHRYMVFVWSEGLSFSCRRRTNLAVRLGECLRQKVSLKPIEPDAAGKKKTFKEMVVRRLSKLSELEFCT